MTRTTKKSQAARLDPAAAPERDPIADLLAQFDPTGIKAKLNRIDPKTRKAAYLETIDPINPATLQEDVQAKHGGGEYRAYIYVNNEYMPGKYLDFSIAGLPKAPNEEERLARIEAKIGAPPAAANGAGLTMIRDIVAIGTPLVAGLGAVLIPLLTRKDGSSAAELLKLTQDAEDRGERRGVEMGRLKASRNGEGENGMMAVANAYLPPLLQAWTDRRRGDAPQTNPSPQTDAMPAPDRAQLSPADPARMPEYAWLTKVRPFLPHLVNQAKIGAQPGVVMEFALSQIPNETLQAIDTATTRPDFQTIMRVELLAHLHQYPEWADEFLAELIEFAHPSGDDDDAPPPAPRAKAGRKK